MTSATSTSRTTQTCSLDQKFSHRPRSAFWALGEHLVEVLGERGDGAVAIVDHGVVVVRHGGRQADVDVEELRCLREAVDERVIGLLVGTQQELPLRAAARDHGEPAGNDECGAAYRRFNGRRLP
jgi:hypothetical protein